MRNQGEISFITTILKTHVKALKIELGDILVRILDTETEGLEMNIIRWQMDKKLIKEGFYNVTIFNWKILP